MNLRQNKAILILLMLISFPIVFAFQNCSQTHFTLGEAVTIAHDSNGMPAVPVEFTPGAEINPDGGSNTPSVQPPEINPDGGNDQDPPIVVIQPAPTDEEIVSGGGGRFVVQAIISGYQIIDGVSYSLSPEVLGTLPCGMPSSLYTQSCNVAVPAVCSSSLRNYIKNQYAKPANGEVTAVIDCRIVEIIGR